MTLAVIGAGFGRTGSLSLHTALNQLGFPCWHMSEVLAHQSKPSHLDFWRDVARGRPGQQYDREQVLAGYTAALDNPACCVWRALMTAYPDAKVVLTLHPRGADAWYDAPSRPSTSPKTPGSSRCWSGSRPLPASWAK